MTESLLSSTMGIIVFSLYFVILLLLGYLGKQAKYALFRLCYYF